MCSLRLRDRIKADIVRRVGEVDSRLIVIRDEVGGGKLDGTDSRDISREFGAVAVCYYWKSSVRVDVASSVASVATGFLRKSALSIYGGRERRHPVRRRERAWRKGRTQVPESTGP